MVLAAGDRASDLLRIELKQIPLGVTNLYQRGAAPDDLFSGAENRAK